MHGSNEILNNALLIEGYVKEAEYEGGVRIPQGVGNLIKHFFILPCAFYPLFCVIIDNIANIYVK